MAHQILAINKMNDYERGTTVNDGVARGGVLSNVIAAEAHAFVDMRFRTVDEGDRITDAMSKLQPVLDANGLPESGFDLEAHVKEVERGYIAEALKKAGGVQVKAADLLGMSFRSFRYYVKKYNLR